MEKTKHGFHRGSMYESLKGKASPTNHTVSGGGKIESVNIV